MQSIHYQIISNLLHKLLLAANEQSICWASRGSSIYVSVRSDYDKIGDLNDNPVCFELSNWNWGIYIDCLDCGLDFVTKSGVWNPKCEGIQIMGLYI